MNLHYQTQSRGNATHLQCINGDITCFLYYYDVGCMLKKAPKLLPPSLKVLQPPLQPLLSPHDDVRLFTHFSSFCSLRCWNIYNVFEKFSF